jgi:diacylglycerol kinase (ATP)
MPTYKRILLIKNPTAGVNWSKALSTRVMRELTDWCPAIEVRTTDSKGHGTELARAAAAEGVDLVIAAGGDGTLNEVLNGAAGTGTAVAFLPSGTGNSMAYSLGMPLHPLEAVASLRQGEVRPAYLGEADGRTFGLMLGVGFDALAVRRVPYSLKRILGRASYLFAGSAALIEYDYPAIPVTAGGRTYEGSTVVIAKTPYYASRFKIAPEVSFEDPFFQVLIFTGRNLFKYIGYVGAVAMNRHLRRRDVVSIQTDEVAVGSVPGLLAHMDGDVLPSVPATVRISQKKVRILFPSLPVS